MLFAVQKKKKVNFLFFIFIFPRAYLVKAASGDSPTPFHMDFYFLGREGFFPIMIIMPLLMQLVSSENERQG